jgi:glycosyltransferase involved in cell wall biosynthesis
MYLFTKGQQIKVYSQVYKKCYDDNIIVESKIENEVLTKCKDYAGAFVFTPEPGLYNWVVPFDFSSLYPTIIIAYNIDYSTLVIDESKIEVVYQDCGIHFRKKHSDEEKNSFLLKHQLPQKFILSVGTLEKRKNQLLLLKAFHEANLQDNSLIFLGKKADLYSDMLQYVRLNGLQNKVFFLDNIEEEELPILYQSAFAFAYISKFEGFGIPILESLRSGVPVLSSKQSSLPEVAGNAALYSDFNDAETLISNLKEISGNPELRLKLINLGYAQASKFDSDKKGLENEKKLTS